MHIVVGNCFSGDVDRPLGKALLFLVLVRVVLLVVQVLSRAARSPGTGGVHTSGPQPPARTSTGTGRPSTGTRRHRPPPTPPTARILDACDLDDRSFGKACNNFENPQISKILPKIRVLVSSSRQAYKGGGRAGEAPVRGRGSEVRLISEGVRPWAPARSRRRHGAGRRLWRTWRRRL